MTGTKISAATDAVTLNATDKLPIARVASSTALYVTGSYIATYTSGVMSSTVLVNTASRSTGITTLTDAATVAVDLNTPNFRLVLGGNRTLGFPTNFPAGVQEGAISVWQDSTGSRTLAYAWCYDFPGGVTPVLSTGKFLMDQLYYRTNYYLTSTVTMTIATPGVVTWTGHGLVSGMQLQLTTTGALPTGLSASTTYWVNVVNANTFNLSTSIANLQAGTFIATSGSQSGVHTAVSASITIGYNINVG